MRYTNRPAEHVINNNKQHLVDNDKIKELTAKSLVIDNEKYSVELGEDVSLPEIETNLVEKHKDITGYTAGLITRDLVQMAEESMMKKNDR